MEQALAGMDEAGIDRAVIHPVMWDPDSNELAVEAARAHPDRFAIMGWFYLDRPESRALVANWKNRAGNGGPADSISTNHICSPGQPTGRPIGCGRR